MRINRFVLAITVGFAGLALAQDTAPRPAPQPYTLQAEDVIQIRVWGEPKLSGTFAIRPDGKITVSAIGDQQAGGLSVAELSKKLKAAFADAIHRDVELSAFVVQVGRKAVRKQP